MNSIPGEQMANVIPNSKVFTNKRYLVTSIMEYEEMQEKSKNEKHSDNTDDIPNESEDESKNKKETNKTKIEVKVKLKMNDFIPETICLIDEEGQDRFFGTFKGKYSHALEVNRRLKDPLC